ncbi:serine hydrolase domain-containing protein [Actinoplanes sp. NPDC089786]|uniref:serine hydrolase domain-containing protein n=1 Tax=Actinoplanes sp. NPDC089786 TaxID=3155185 RepID=UPI0034256809
MKALAVTLATAVALTGAPLAAGQSATAKPPTRDAVQRALDGLVGADGFPGALASVRQTDGRTRDYTSGVGDLRTGAKVPVDGRVRIASNTKMFTSVVVLQLVGEGKVDLDAPIEDYLPGLVRGDHWDGHDITVRQLLQHTSGLPDYDDLVTDLLDIQHRYWEPREMVDAALARTEGPGHGEWSYSNTNYILAGLLVQKVTGRPIGEEITNRIITPLGLRDTYWPGVGDQEIRGAHPHGYHKNKPGDPWTDVTVMDPSMGWAAGQLIASPSDVNRFLTALIKGRLLKPAQLEQMQTTVDAPGFDTRGDAKYGLGIATFTLTCGGIAWQHGGNSPGYTTVDAVTTTGKSATIAVTALPTALEQVTRLENALDAALCR